MPVQTPTPPETERPVRSGTSGVITGDDREDGDGADARAGARGRRGGVSRAHRSPPARAAAALLPDPRLDAGRRGPGAGDAAGGVAGARGVRGPSLGARLALPDRDEPLPERAARPGRAAHGRYQAMAEPPEPTRRTEPIWLEPYPDVLLEDIPDRSPGPEARYEARESSRAGVHRRPSAPAAPPARGARAARRARLPHRRGRRDARHGRGLGQGCPAARPGDARDAAAGRRPRSRAAAELRPRARARRALCRRRRDAATSTASSPCSPTTPC